MGIGVPISIDGVTPASLVGHPGPGNPWGWLDDTTCAGQADLGTGYLLRKLVLPNTLTVLDSTPSGVTDATTQFRAGNNFWASFLAGGPLVGVRSTIRARLPNAALGDLDDTGRMAVVQNYVADAGIVVYNTVGAQLWVNSTSVQNGTNRLRAKDGSVAYEDTSSQWHLRSITTGVLQSFAPRTDEIVSAMVPVSISGTTYVVELTDTQLTIRPATSPIGYVLATSANLFNPDAVSLSAGTVRVGWSITTGEGSTHLRMADLTISTGEVSLGSTTTGTLVFDTPTSGTTGQFAVGPVEGGTLAGLKQPRRAIKDEAFISPDGKRVYQRYWDQTATQAFAPPNLSQATGVLQPANGGTGNTSGTTVINGENIMAGTVDIAQLAPMFPPAQLVPQVNLSVLANTSSVVVRSLTLGTTESVTIASGGRLRIL
jgi:hypothetical protein